MCVWGAGRVGGGAKKSKYMRFAYLLAVVAFGRETEEQREGQHTCDHSINVLLP